MTDTSVISRRHAIALPMAVLLAQPVLAALPASDAGAVTYVARLRARPGAREALSKVLSDQQRLFSGCLFFTTAQDRTDPDVFWTVEAWQDEISHSTAVNTPAMQNVIARCRPLLAAYEPVVGANVLTIAMEDRR